MGAINEKNFPKFKELYELALQRNKESFSFEGQEVLVLYAKYVIEYFNMTLGVSCLQCGYGPWKPRGTGRPNFCPSCHSKDWDKPKRPRKGANEK